MWVDGTFRTYVKLSIVVSILFFIPKRAKIPEKKNYTKVNRGLFLPIAVATNK